jgi:hypothetical protein
MKKYVIDAMSTDFDSKEAGYGVMNHDSLIVAYFSGGVTNKPPISEEEILKILEPTFSKLGLIPTGATFREDAGCTICNCRPGYCIDVDGIVGGIKRIMIRLHPG